MWEIINNKIIDDWYERVNIFECSILYYNLMENILKKVL